MRAIPDDNLAYPMLLEVGGESSGSGFLLTTGTAQYLISAKHVFLDSAGNLRALSAVGYSQFKDPNEEGRGTHRLDLEKLKSNGCILDHSPRDVIAIRLGTLKSVGEMFQLNAEAGVVVEAPANSSLVQVKREATKLVKDVLIGNDAVIFGYPVSIGIKGLAAN